MQKHKLIPKNKREKIKDLMKSFQYLDTYVDINDVVLAIEEHIDRELHEEDIE